MGKVDKCFLRCVQNLHSPISLLDGQEVILGRCIATDIRDLQLSRKQVSLTANYKTAAVAFKQIGPNISGLNGKRVEKDEQYYLKDLDRIELLLGKYVYEINFEPKPDYTKQNRNSAGENNKERTKCETINEKTPQKRLRSPDEAAGGSSKKFKILNSSATRTASVEMNESSGESSKCDKDQWEDIDSGKLLIFTKAGVKHSAKIAAYDLDGTIIKTKSGLVFARDMNDWQIALPQIPGKLKELSSNGYKLVIFTNQAGIGKGSVKPNDFKKKIENIIKKLGIPIQVFISTGKGMYRKPLTGMWKTLIEQKNGGIAVSKDECFYCGDAAGRPDKWAPGKKKDFSCADRLMAINLNLTFYTPEEHFQKLKHVQWIKPEFNPIALKDENLPRFDPPNTKLIGKGQEVIILVGCPGSGKSFIGRELAQAGYVHINRDTLGTWQKCVSTLKNALKDGKSAVVDNTNPDKETRKRYIDASGNVKVRCGLMSTTLNHCRHNNLFRELIDKKHVAVADMILYSYRKKFEEPILSEGYSEIFKINFIPDFKNKEHEKLYYMYLIEK